jgi:hypothetical protein
MSIDRRLREGFERLSGDADASVDAELERVMRRGRRQRALTRGATALSIAASLIILGVFGPRLLDAGGRSDPRPGDEPTPLLSAIAGTYTATLPDVGGGTIARNDMAGRWTLTLGLNGTIELVAPPAFGTVPSGYSFELDVDDRFTTNLFVNDSCGDQGAGLYRWRGAGSELTFIAVDEPCPIRETLLTTAPWVIG